MSFGETTSAEIDRVAHEIVDAAFKIHSKLGPGLLESAYQAFMTYELEKRGLAVASEVPLPVVYEDVRLDLGYRIDLIVNDCVLVELESGREATPDSRSTDADVPEIDGKAFRLAHQLQYKIDQRRNQANGPVTTSCASCFVSSWFTIWICHGVDNRESSYRSRRTSR
jgi:GxxExxY protein